MQSFYATHPFLARSRTTVTASFELLGSNLGQLRSTRDHSVCFFSETVAIPAAWPLEQIVHRQHILTLYLGYTGCPILFTPVGISGISEHWY